MLPLFFFIVQFIDGALCNWWKAVVISSALGFCFFGMLQYRVQLTGLSYYSYSEWTVVGNGKFTLNLRRDGNKCLISRKKKNYLEEIILDSQNNHLKSHCGCLQHILSNPPKSICNHEKTVALKKCRGDKHRGEGGTHQKATSRKCKN